DWGKLKVVITGSALPRKENLATQYFARLLGVPGEGPRLVYAEGLYEEAKALRLLNASAVDTRLGEVFFDDPARMHRDLLADAAHSKELGQATSHRHPGSAPGCCKTLPPDHFPETLPSRWPCRVHSRKPLLLLILHRMRPIDRGSPRRLRFFAQGILSAPRPY